MSMHDDEFQSLAMKVLAGEASPDERAALERCVQAEPSRLEEWNELRAGFELSREVLPLAEALDAQAAPLPAHRMNQLRSAVRLHFQKVDAEAKSDASAGGLGWWTAWSRWVLSGAAAALAVMLVVAAWPGPSGIEVGLYAESTTRGVGKSVEVASTPHVRVTRFESDGAFDQWLARPFAPDEKARVWFDEEHDLIHVRMPSTWWRGSREFTQPLPASDAQRQESLQSLLRSL